MNYNLPQIMESKLFEGFTNLECKEFCSNIEPECKMYSKNQTVINEGEKLNFIGIVCSGKLVKAKLEYTGKLHLLEIIGKYRTFGMEIAGTPSQISPITIACLEDSSVVFFNYEKIWSAMPIPVEYRMKAIRNIVNLIANDNVKKLYKIEALSQKSLRNKILVHLYLRMKKAGNNTFKLGLNREQLADYLCVNRSALSHELSRMQQEGLISFRKDVFTIHSDK